MIDNQIGCVALKSITATYFHTFLVGGSDKGEDVEQDAIFTVLGKGSERDVFKMGQRRVPEKQVLVEERKRYLLYTVGFQTYILILEKKVPHVSNQTGYSESFSRPVDQISYP
jgi:hypothetical protein